MDERLKDLRILEADDYEDVRQAIQREVNEQNGALTSIYNECQRCGSRARATNPLHETEHICAKCYAIENLRPMARRTI
jgi:hypothetical protein